MTSGYPVAVVVEAPPVERTSPGTAPIEIENAGSWRYDGRRNSRTLVLLAAALSAALHAGLLLGFGPARSRPAPKPVEENLIALRLAIPDLKELEEPDPVVSDDASPPDPGLPVPMQADVPQLARPNDFVQAINFASLLEPPDFSQLKVYAVPEHIRTGGKLAEQIGKIFNLADLDRTPEPVLQPSPQFPISMRREAQTGKVVVEFIVDPDGRVMEPFAVESTHHGFDEAALSGVSRWKFRPGFKSGRKVYTRMRVPILFTLLDDAS